MDVPDISWHESHIPQFDPPLERIVRYYQIFLPLCLLSVPFAEKVLFADHADVFVVGRRVRRVEPHRYTCRSCLHREPCE